MSDVPTLQTERFTLRPLRRDDAAALLPTLSDPVQCLYLTRPAFTSAAQLWEWFAAPDWPGRTWIAEDASGDVAGRFIAVPAHAPGVVEIGYITAKHRQGEGVSRECTRALIEHLFAEGARKLIAEVDTRNVPSVHVLERFGFVREAHFREHETTHAGMCDVYWYGLLRREWR